MPFLYKVTKIMSFILYRHEIKNFQCVNEIILKSSSKAKILILFYA